MTPARRALTLEESFFECDQCGNRFHSLLTDGRCTACGHRHGHAHRAGGAGARVLDLTGTPAGFLVTLAVVGAVQLVLFLLAVTLD